MQSFIRRNLCRLPFLSGAPDSGRFSDIANAYGYGGPVCSIAKGEEDIPFTGRLLLNSPRGARRKPSPANSAAFIAHDRASARLIGDTLPVAFVKDVIIIELGADESKIASGLRKGHRSSIALARRSGVRIEKVEPSVANLEAFRAMYEATMLRRQAAERWFLPEGFFR